MQTNSDPSTGIIIKSDRSGRVRYTDEFKREVLAAYESSSLSGPDFVSGQQSRKRSTEPLSHFCHRSQSYGIYAMRASAVSIAAGRVLIHSAGSRDPICSGQSKAEVGK